MMPTTSDGAEFHLGMTLYVLTEDDLEIREIPTSPETHELDTFQHEGRRVYCLMRKGSSGGVDLQLWSSSKRGAVEMAILKHRYQIGQHEQAIRDLESLTEE